MIGLVSASAIAALSASAPAPRSHCGVETRVWCLETGNDSLSMSEDQGSRVWAIVSPDVLGRITVRESANCDSVRDDGGLDATRTSEKREMVGRELRTSISYDVPGYECTVIVSWNSAPDDLTRWKGQVRRNVLSIIWLGVHEKRPLMYVLENACLKAGGAFSRTLTCSLMERR